MDWCEILILLTHMLPRVDFTDKTLSSIYLSITMDNILICDIPSSPGEQIYWEGADREDDGDAVVV